MTETKICCDHCGKELDPMRDYDETEITMYHKWQTVDLCCECFNDLWDIIYDFCTEQEDT